MKTSLSIVKKAGIQPKLRLATKTSHGIKSTGMHRVKMIADKELKQLDGNGVETDYVRYLVEENGEIKTYQTKKYNKNGEVSYLVQRLAEITEGTEVILEMKKQGIKNYVSVSPVDKTDNVEMQEDEDIEEYQELPEKITQ